MALLDHNFIPYFALFLGYTMHGITDKRPFFVKTLINYFNIWTKKTFLVGFPCMVYSVFMVYFNGLFPQPSTFPCLIFLLCFIVLNFFYESLRFLFLYIPKKLHKNPRCRKISSTKKFLFSSIVSHHCLFLFRPTTRFFISYFAFSPNCLIVDRSHPLVT